VITQEPVSVSPEQETHKQEAMITMYILFIRAFHMLNPEFLLQVLLSRCDRDRNL